MNIQETLQPVIDDFVANIISVGTPIIILVLVGLVLLGFAKWAFNKIAPFFVELAIMLVVLIGDKIAGLFTSKYRH